MVDKLYAIPERDRVPLRRLLNREREITSLVKGRPPKDGRGSRPVLVLSAPSGWTAGRVVNMKRRVDQKWVYDFALLGYPILRVNQSFTVTWTFGTSVLTSTPVAPTATAAAFLSAQPATIRELIKEVYGGMVTDPADTDLEYDIGRWFVSFDIQPDYVPTSTFGWDTSLNQEVALRISKTVLAPSGACTDVWDIGGAGAGIRPVHPGSLAVASQSGSGLVLTSVEPRVYVPL